MRILQVISSYPPAYAYGGPARVAHDVSRELVKRGHEVAVYTTDAYDGRNRRQEVRNPDMMDGVAVHRFRNVSNRLAYANLPLAPAMARALRDTVDTFDVVHLHEYRTCQAGATGRCAASRGVPYVLQAHGDVPKIMGKRALKTVYDRLWGSELLKGAARLIALTSIEAEHYRAMGVAEERIEIIPNGIDLSDFTPLPPAGRFRMQHGLVSGERLILFLGRVHQIKGTDLLARAFARLSGQIGQVRLVIAGPDNGYLEALTRLTEDLSIRHGVIFAGPLYGEDKLRALVDADVFVLPSSYETFPVSVLEAVACGTPVVVTDRCGIAQLVEEVGRVAEHNDASLSNVLVEVLSDTSLRRDVAGTGRALLRDGYTIQAVTDRLEELYEKCSTQEVQR